MSTLTQAKRCRGTTRASIMSLECYTDALESTCMPVLTTSNCQMVVHLLKRLNSYDAAFMKHHFIILDLIEKDDNAQDEQKRKLDDHEDKVSNFAYRLEQLAHPSAPTPPTKASVLRTKDDEVAPPVPAADSSRGLARRLDHVESSLRLVSASLAPITPGPKLDICLVQHLKEEVSDLR